MLSLRDPLGTGRARPPPPADPDAYDAAREEVEGGRSLLSAADLAELKRDVAAHGLLDIAAVRSALALGRAGSDDGDGDGDNATVDPEMLLAVDVRVGFKVFLAGGEAYTRDDLYDHFAFHELGVTPEDVFAAQLVDAFPPRNGAAVGGAAGYGGCDLVARDADDDSVAPGRVDDLVAGVGRRGHAASHVAPLRTARTKVYVGRSRWEDFVALSRVCRGAVHVARRGGAVLALAGSGAAAGQFAIQHAHIDAAVAASAPAAGALPAADAGAAAPAAGASLDTVEGAAAPAADAALWAAVADLQRRVAALEAR